MGILTKFLATHILQSLESEFVIVEPELQAILLAEAKLLVSNLENWIHNKLANAPLAK
jgi:hypothetical protein